MEELSDDTKPIPGYEDCFAGRDGKLWVEDGEGKLFEPKTWIGSGGYSTVNIDSKLLSVHRLICAAFHGVASAGQERLFIDGNQRNLRADNLAWGTRSDVMQGSVRRGTARPPKQPPGERCAAARFTDAQIVEMVRLYKAGVPGKQIAKQFGCHRSYPYLLATRRTTRQVPTSACAAGVE